MPRAKGIWRVEWRTCDRCGFLHPINLLTKQLGLMVCKCHGCHDDLIMDRRPKMIAEVLGGSQEGTSDQGQIYSDPGEVIF